MVSNWTCKGGSGKKVGSFASVRAGCYLHTTCLIYWAPSLVGCFYAEVITGLLETAAMKVGVVEIQSG